MKQSEERVCATARAASNPPNEHQLRAGEVAGTREFHGIGELALPHGTVPADARSDLQSSATRTSSNRCLRNALSPPSYFERRNSSSHDRQEVDISTPI
eukprot:6186863-Pleurochrysis_carterae.AAC.2